MALTEEGKKKIKDFAVSIAGSVGMTAAFMAAEKAIEIFTTSNIHEQDVSGDRNVQPTKDGAVLDEKNAKGNSNEAVGAKDDVRGQQGDVDASASHVNANENTANASDTGAIALNTNAGATEISTKAMKMN